MAARPPFSAKCCWNRLGLFAVGPLLAFRIDINTLHESLLSQPASCALSRTTRPKKAATPNSGGFTGFDPQDDHS